ncbi:MAG: peptidoglycan recognition family protein [Bacteroidota bacterium]|nr:peptidoglycan recognition family protein [Bacteroidota bacterium]
MNENVLLFELILKLAAILGSSLLIERLLVFFGLAINRMFILKYSNTFTRAEKVQERIRREGKAAEEEELLTDESLQDEDLDEVPFNPSLPEERKQRSGFDLLLIRPIKEILDDKERYQRYKENNVIVKEFWMQILGTLIAIFICRALNFSIWEFFRYYSEGGFPEEHSTFEYIFTGIIIGAGSKPINFLMKFLVNRKIHADSEEVKAESRELHEGDNLSPSPDKAAMEVSAQTKMIEPESIEDRIGFVYDGGDRPERLENTHRYRQSIDLIVYHHTAMHSDAPFVELVKEFDRKGWLTGYHCVVFKDGSIRVLCRWDRIGNHALPHNGHSFGIAFQGNFETNPGIPFSNPDGKSGILAPTGKQIKAAARVVAMYALLRNISLEFPASLDPGDRVKGIIPHRLIANKACPGSNFPEEEFKQNIISCHNSWKDDADFRKALELFRKKPMLIM